MSYLATALVFLMAVALIVWQARAYRAEWRRRQELLEAERGLWRSGGMLRADEIVRGSDKGVRRG